MADYSLICPFLDESAQYAYGVEFGMLYARMRDGGEDVIDGLFLRANQDQILLLASRLRWTVEKVGRPVYRDWFHVVLRRSHDGKATGAKDG